MEFSFFLCYKICLPDSNNKKYITIAETFKVVTLSTKKSGDTARVKGVSPLLHYAHLRVLVEMRMHILSYALHLTSSTQ